MEVDAPQIEILCFLDLLHSDLSMACLNRKSELGIENSGSCKAVGLCVHTGRHTHQHRLNHSLFGSNFVQHIDLGEAIDGDFGKAVFNCLRQLLPVFVVAVEIHPGGREPNRFCDGQLSAGDNIDANTFCIQYLDEGRVRERLGGVRDVRILVSPSERAQKVAGSLSNRGFVVDVQRASVFADQISEIASANGQMPI